MKVGKTKKIVTRNTIIHLTEKYALINCQYLTRQQNDHINFNGVKFSLNIVMFLKW